MHASTPLVAGATAPSFTLPGRSGNTVSLADFAGKGHVLVYFYPKDDTPGCTKEACSLRDGFGGLREAGVTVLGISPDDADSHNAFAGKYSLPFELLTDADHAVRRAYGAGRGPRGASGSASPSSSARTAPRPRLREGRRRASRRRGPSPP
ncbi:MAG: peroxiredoxin [Holophagales bacterium]|nr:peroxiredoxin [Holophagales bacterium]